MLRLLLPCLLVAACWSPPRPEIQSPRRPEPELAPLPPGPVAPPPGGLTVPVPDPFGPAAPAPAAEPPPPAPPPIALAGEPLRRRYALVSAKQTLTSDRGDGHDALYGTRNVRAVLDGVLFRGGANNFFHRGGKRPNKNPLPPDGLANLCREGFGSAVYLYPNNFGDAARETTCETVAGSQSTLRYEQRTTQHGRRSDLRFIFELVLDSVRHPERGAVYVHCWNGWHASGFVGAVALRQFCGYTAEQGLRYWNATARGASNAEHEDTRKRIAKFKPFPELLLTAEERAQVCPDPRSFKFTAPASPSAQR